MLYIKDGRTKKEPYIQTDGGQYILTDILPTGATRVVMDICALETSATVAIFGSRKNTTAGAYCIWNFASGSSTWYRCDYGSSRRTTANLPNGSVIPAGERFVLETTPTALMINNNVLVSGNASTFDVGYPMAIFSINTTGTVDARRYKCKLYSCQIYDGSVLKRDFVPAQNDNGKAGLYDMVTKKYFNNNGTGSFVYGTEDIAGTGWTEAEKVLKKTVNGWETVNTTDYPVYFNTTKKYSVWDYRE